MRRPVGKGAFAEEGLGGPFGEVDGEGDTVAVEAGENDDVLGFRVMAKDWAGFFGKENRAGPAVRDADVFEGGMKIADAGFERAETIDGLASANVKVLKAKPEFS